MKLLDVVLMLVSTVCRDYGKAGLPMHIVFGDQETRTHILLYSMQVVALTLMMPVVGIGRT